VLDENVFDDVALLMEPRGVRLKRRDRVGDRRERLVPDGDRPASRASSAVSAATIATGSPT
jgi:hypothetical protein